MSGGTSPSLEVSPRMPRYVDDKAASDLKVYLFHGGIVCKPTEKRNKRLVSHVQPLTALKSQADAEVKTKYKLISEPQSTRSI